MDLRIKFYLWKIYDDAKNEAYILFCRVAFILRRMIAAILKITKTPLLLRADSKGGVFDIRGISVDDYQFVVWQIIPDGMSEADGLTVIDRRNVYAASLELVDESLVVIGTHTSPAGIVDLTIEYFY